MRPKPPAAGKGRRKGTPNKITAAFKAAVLRVYEARGGDAAFLTWANKHQTDFYKICARLIPHEVTGEDGGPVEVRYSWLTQPKTS